MDVNEHVYNLLQNQHDYVLQGNGKKGELRFCSHVQQINDSFTERERFCFYLLYN